MSLGACPLPPHCGSPPHPPAASAGPAESLFKESYYQLMKTALKEDGILCCQGEGLGWTGCCWVSRAPARRGAAGAGPGAAPGQR